MNLYSIKDLLSSEFAPPFQAQNDLVALRVARQMFRNVPFETVKDFRLYSVGVFDDKTGVFSQSVGQPEEVIGVLFSQPANKEVET